MTAVGVDLGTGSLKITAIRDDGSRMAVRSDPYGIDAPHPGWAEQDPERWWSEATRTAALLAAELGGEEVVVGFTGQMHTFVLQDDRGRVLRPGMLWCDRRAGAEAADVAARVPGYERITGHPALPTFTLPQLLWVRDHEPEVFARAAHALLAKDYLRWRATGERATDVTDASATGLLDTRTRAWSPEVLGALDLDPALLPAVRSATADAGALDELFPGARSVVGVGDQFAEALSAGIRAEGDLAIGLGTSATLLALADEPVPGSFCFTRPDTWMRLESVHAGGRSLTWFADAFLDGAAVSVVLERAARSVPGAHGVLFLPFLLGDRLAGDGGAPAGFVGVTTATTLADLARAVVEGVTFELRRLHDAHAWPVGATPVALKGGGSASTLWAETIGAVFDRPYRRVDRDAAFGAAHLAGVAAGRFTLGEFADPELPVRDPKADDVRTLALRHADYLDALSRLTP